ncbi:MAG: Flp pilus assembly complex ATPase component TadA, partial [Planctomycetales bacterium]|nr:Flp pilus assembly complex ATPase component TadA [Planctomycetales bacterium]
MAGRLGDILVRLGYLTGDDLEAVLNRREQGRLGTRLLKSGLITISQLGEALQEQHQVPFERLATQSIHAQVIRLIPEDFARSRYVVPIDVRRRKLTLAMEAPDDVAAISEAELITGYEIEPVVALQSEIQSVLDFGFDDRLIARQTVVDLQLDEMNAEDEREVVVEESFEDDSAPVVRLVSATLAGAITNGASDVHLEPHSPEMRVRYRIDGELQQVMTIPKHIEDSVIARIKVMADMDTTENRRPQDGHLSVFESGKKVNFRVSTIPTVDGEKLVLRLLDEGSKVFTLDAIAFPPSDRERIDTMLDKPHGMIVLTGPTGSGKSTTMYAMLTRINRVQRNIVTVEDPVEFRLPGINQVQSDNEFGMGFANALRHIMRQDPDVIMVGEIRDRETAGISVQAALTG